MEKYNSTLSKDQIYRIICQLLAHEISLQRKSPVAWQQINQWDMHRPIYDNGSGADSIEINCLQIRVEQFFQLNRSNPPPLLSNVDSLNQWSEAIYDYFMSNSIYIGFLTSGTTGTPKHCIHNLKTLQEEISYLAELFKASKRIVSLVPCYHIYGFLFTVLLPLKLKVNLLDAKALSPIQLSNQLASGDLVIGYPDYWKYCINNSLVIPKNIHIVSSTSQCPDYVKNAMISLSNTSSFIDIYGSSETGGIGYKIWPEKYYTLFPFWENINSLLHRKSLEITSNHFSMPDRMIWVNDRQFEVLERYDNCVQVAGINVSVTKVERYLCQHPAVKACCVRKMCEDEGDRLKAFIMIEPTHNQKELILSLTHWVNKFLTAVERPKHFTCGSELPTNEYGKLTNWSITS
ncbi:AMP-binding protein [Zooshikella marina]|uniref:AMP-binding protein n=1 Tax=Zooshikella ganghwensis TaxID=202772 RepID=UPI001BB001F9|nr:AMP-binding protein [Zooshikella ganghwensis]MBU2708208.1 AMP-binding protein [Zooshikella ganghwensis]